MSGKLKRGLLLASLRLARLPSLPPPAVDPETETGFAAAASERRG
jgi:hypothetical protein